PPARHPASLNGRRQSHPAGLPSRASVAASEGTSRASTGARSLPTAGVPHGEANIGASMTTVSAPAPQRHLTDLTLDFLATLELERGLSRNTLEAYRSDLQQYGAYLGRINVDPLRAIPTDVAGFISELADGRQGKAPLGPATLQRKIACLRSFYRHLRREQLIDHDPTAELRPPRSPG